LSMKLRKVRQHRSAQGGKVDLYRQQIGSAVYHEIHFRFVDRPPKIHEKRSVDCFLTQNVEYEVLKNESHIVWFRQIAENLKPTSSRRLQCVATDEPTAIQSSFNPTPSSRTTSSQFSTVVSRCAIIIMVNFPFNVLNASIKACSVSLSNAEVASSRIKTSGAL